MNNPPFFREGTTQPPGSTRNWLDITSYPMYRFRCERPRDPHVTRSDRYGSQDPEGLHSPRGDRGLHGAAKTPKPAPGPAHVARARTLLSFEAGPRSNRHCRPSFATGTARREKDDSVGARVDSCPARRGDSPIARRRPFSRAELLASMTLFHFEFRRP
jgi:hypothetical protein